ncbi:MAG: hypothetical protein IH948_02810, partial [Bacteroidetes bacterium]|nr:hypothetical protein [Bacteroidota bacterium]
MRYLSCFLVIFVVFCWEVAQGQDLCLLKDKDVTQKGFKKLPEDSYRNKEAKADSAFQLSVCYYKENNIIWQIWMLISKDLYKQSIVAKSKKFTHEKASLDYKIGLCHYYLKEYKQANN